MLKVYYRISENLRKKMFIDSGVIPQTEQEAFLDLSSVSTEIREKIIRFPLIELLNTDLLFLSVKSYSSARSAWIDSGDFSLRGVEFRVDAIITEISQVLPLIDQMESEMKELWSHKLLEETKKLERAISSQSYLPSLPPIHNAKAILIRLGLENDFLTYFCLAKRYSSLRKELSLETQAKGAALAAAKLAEEAECKAKAEAAAKAQSDWIAEFGSERLKLMSAGGFKGTHVLYEAERAFSDFPEAIIDLCDSSEYLDAVSPSLNALKALKAFLDSHQDCSGKLVILSQFPSAVWEEKESEVLEKREDETGYPSKLETWEAIRINSPIFTHYLFIIL